MLPSGTNATSEHKVELLRLCNFIIGIRIPDVEFSAEVAQFWTRIIIQLQLISRVDAGVK